VIKKTKITIKTKAKKKDRIKHSTCSNTQDCNGKTMCHSDIIS